MTPQEFYDYAKQKHACVKGLYWLKSWINNNPNKTLKEFFESKMNIKNGKITNSYLSWCTVALVHWTIFKHSYSKRSDLVRWITNGRANTPMDFTRKESCEYLIFIFCNDRS